MSTRAIGAPRPAHVVTGATGSPHAVLLDGRRRRVVAVRDDWLVQDRWWTEQPIDRHYFEVILEPGRLMVLYRQSPSGEWFAHP